MEKADGYALKIDRVFTARELEEFILELSQRRARMAPEVPAKQPENIPTVQHASVSIDVAPDGITMHFRSNGLGWLGYRINLAGVEGLRDFLNLHFPAPLGGGFGKPNA